VKRRLALLAVVAGGLVLWNAGFGFLPTERTIRFRFPVPARDVRRFDVAVWDESALLARRTEDTPQGFDQEPSLKLALGRGTHRAVGTIWIASEAEPRSYQSEFDPAELEELAVSFAR
jgi:hypothetical protein